MPELSRKGLFETMRMTRAVNYGKAEFGECRGKVLKAGSKSRGNKAANCALYLISKRVVDLRLNHVPESFVSRPIWMQFGSIERHSAVGFTP
jgi:hypothetical protein